ncbi:hypothetical protein [Actinomadura kijaniata]|nr:hypothetical protein [Actinomadura kijaniata]
MLKLRILTAGGDPDVYWRHHLECKHRRVHPGSGKDEYNPSA